MKKEFVLLGALVFASLACGWAFHGKDTSPVPLAATAPIFQGEIDLPTFEGAAADKSATILDARPAKAYDAAHVPGAANLPLADFTAIGARHPALAGISFDRQIMVYCASARCPDSSAVAKKLTELGYRRVAVFRDGIKGWRAAGQATEPSL
jgi:rhodanese-related sulfurtransferase